MRFRFETIKRGRHGTVRKENRNLNDRRGPKERSCGPTWGQDVEPSIMITSDCKLKEITVRIPSV